MGNIFTDLFSKKPAEDAAKAKIAGINAGLTSANSALDTGQAGADALYDRGYSDFSALTNKFGKGFDAYQDATGANGADGVARATAIFRSLPGYNAGRDMGINDLERRAAARGDLGGGNTSADTLKFASDYDAGKFGNYVAGLTPNLTGVSSATAGGAGMLSSRAAADLGVAGQKANLGYQGNAAIGGANADKELAAYSASQNFWGALMGGANTLLKATGVGGFAPSGGGTGGVAGWDSYGGTTFPKVGGGW